jgi:hypothetical protein
MFSVVLVIVGLIAVVAIVEGLVARRTLGAQLVEARAVVPIDEATGLLNHRAYAQRVTGEIKRAGRTHNNLWLSVWTIVEGDSDQFGRIAADSLRFPEIGFRLDERVYCFLRPGIDEAGQRELYTRLAAATRRVRIAVGEQTWTPSDSSIDARALLNSAIDRMQ